MGIFNTAELDMKKILGLLVAIFLSATVAFGTVACSKNSGSSDKEQAFTIKYELNEDDENDVYYTLTGFTVSDKAQKLANKGDYAALAALFNKQTGKNDYTAETVRTFTVASEYKADGATETRPVKKIAASAVSGLTFLKEITVPSSVEKIAAGAFSNLTSLEKITLPFTGEKVGAVNGNKSFGYIFGTSAGNGLTSCTQQYNEGSSASTAYYIPTTLKTVVITGDNKSEAGETVYYKHDVKNNKNYVLTKEEYDAFEETEEFTKHTLTSGAKKNYAVPAYAFYGCTTLETITLSGKIEKIDDYTFSGCTSVKKYSLEGVTEEVGNYAFNGCTSLIEVNFKGVKTIGAHAFDGCTSLGKESTVAEHPVKLADVTVIGEYAFNGCTAITRVTLNANGVKLGKCAFKGCSELKKVDNKPADAPTGDEDPFLNCHKDLNK